MAGRRPRRSSQGTCDETTLAVALIAAVLLVAFAMLTWPIGPIVFLGLFCLAMGVR